MAARDLGLVGTQSIVWTVKQPGAGLTPLSVTVGTDPSHMALQVAVADWSGSGAPTREALKNLHVDRQAKKLFPLVVVAVSGPASWVYGPAADADVIALPVEKAGRVLQAALAEPTGLAARQRLGALHRAVGSGQEAGVVNRGLFAGHFLQTSVREREDWDAASTTATAMLSLRHEPLIKSLGFSVLSAGQALLLNAGDAPRAIAVLLDAAEQFDAASKRFDVSPVAFGLRIAGKHEVPWLIVLRGTQIRLYPARPGVGVGQKGQVDTWFELDLAVIDDDQAGLLPLVFSAAALGPGGSTQELLDGSAQFAVELGERLRDRIYERVVPDLARAVAVNLPLLGMGPDAEGLDMAYRLTMRILFRLLFQAYAEDRGLLPYGRNSEFDSHSLNKWAKDLAHDSDVEFDPNSTSVWDDLVTVWRVIDSGDAGWDVPAYNGGLFGRDRTLHPEGHLLTKVSLDNATMGVVLRGMLVDDIDGGGTGAVDFRSLSVREFGTIYEGLLESSLSVAPIPLTLDKTGTYVPVLKGAKPEVRKGEVYFHSASGQRKSTGTYYTPHIVVEHLLSRALDPVLDEHLQQVRALLDKHDQAGAADMFFDFRVADLAMGSAHFLTAAIDHIEARMRDFLTEFPIPSVADELRKLEQAAISALGDDAAAVADIDPAALLRRQIARRCIYGLDINPMAVELARLAIWITTFVPGLPMSSLDHTLVCANSLTGVGTVDEAVHALDPAAESGQLSTYTHAIESELAKAKVLLLDAANASEATKADVTAAAHTALVARKAAEPARVLFDAVVARRLGLLDPEDFIDETRLLKAARRPDVAEAVAVVQPAHFPFLFPEVFLRDEPGFDVLVGNPPWDKLRHEPQQYWVLRDPGLHALSGSKREERIEWLRENDPVGRSEEERQIESRDQIAQALQGGYALQKSQHHDLAKLFAERNPALLRGGGSAGLVLPQAFAVLGGWAPIRHAWLRDWMLEVQPLRNGGGWVFPEVHAQMTVVLVVLRPGSGVRVSPAASSRRAFLRAMDVTALVMTDKELAELSDDACIPWFEHEESPRLFRHLAIYPSLSSGGGWIRGRADSTRWDFSGSGPHKQFVSSKGGRSAWRVTMTRHVDAYRLTDDAEGRWIANPSELVPLGKGLVNRRGSVELSLDHPPIVYRFPTNNDNSRTLIATLLPSHGWLYSKGYAHGVAIEGDATLIDVLALLGLMNSLVSDWWARRFVDRHLGKRIVEGLRLPPWGEAERNEVAGLVAELLRRGGQSTAAGYGALIAPPHHLSELAHFELLARIDEIVLTGFQLGDRQLQVLLEDFSTKPGAVPAEYRAALRQRKDTDV